MGDFSSEAALATSSSFRDALLSSSAIVAGSMASYFIDRTAYGPHTVMDVMVPPKGLRALEMWLLSHEFGKIQGALTESSDDEEVDELMPSPVWAPWGEPAIRQVLVFVRFRSGRKIRLLVCEGPPVEGILHSPLSSMMNFFDHESAYSLFPITTFEKRCSVLNRPHGYINSGEAVRCRDKGWTVSTRVAEEDASDREGEWWEGVRCLGDARTLRMRLEPPLPGGYKGLMCGNSWTMRYKYRWGLRPDIMYEIVACAKLTEQYVVYGVHIADRLYGIYRSGSSGVEDGDTPSDISADEHFLKFSVEAAAHQRSIEMLSH